MIFKADTTLITPYEVIQFAPSAAHADTMTKRTHIVSKEEKLFNDCFGYDFYLKLIADLIDYPSDSYSDFSKHVSYNVDDVVLFEGQLYKAIQEQASGNIQSVNNKLYWSIAPKFNNVKYQFLWIRYLRELLAWNVVHTSALYTMIQLTGIGLQKKKTENSDSIDLKELAHYKAEVTGDIMDIISNMETYILRNKEDFKDYKAVKELCADNTNNCPPKKRFYGWGGLS